MVSDSKVVQSPIFSADYRYLEEILALSQSNLKGISPVSESYRAKLPVLATAVADALHHINQALAILEDPQSHLASED